MTLLSLNIGDLLVQLLPGFLSLWVFSRITAENLDNRSDWILVMLGLCFGMFNLSVVSLLCLALKAGGDHPVLFSEAFWPWYACLVVISLVVGGIAGILRAKGWWPATVVASLASRAVGRTQEDPEYETCLRVIENHQLDENTVVRVRFMDGSGREIVGKWGGSTDSDFLVTDSHLFSADDFPFGKPYSCCVRDNGVVIEYIIEK